MATNNFLIFCPTDTGTNLLTQGDYAAAADRTSGNQPGVASSKLVNKALRQSSEIASTLAQVMSDLTGADMLDDGTTTSKISMLTALMTPLPSIVRTYTSGSGNHDKSYVFFISSGSATVGATYTNNGVTFTVSATVASALKVIMTGNGVPTASGTLTKASGTGDATLTFYAVRAPISLNVRAVGGGGGSSGGGTTNPTGGNGGDTTFGTTLIVASGGAGGGNGGSGTNGGAGGAATLGTGPVGIAIAGAWGNGGISNPGTANTWAAGGPGGNSFFGGAGGTLAAGPGKAAATNSGSGASGGSGASTSGHSGGGGGGSGGYVDGTIDSPATRYAYAVGAAGTAGSAGTGGSAGAVGGAGLIIATEIFQ